MSTPVPQSSGDSTILRFGTYEVDVAEGALRKQGVRVRLQEQPFQVLLALADRPLEIVSRDELRQRLWPDTQVDFDRGLNKAVNRLREALGDDADNPRFIETVPQRGYRFLVPVERGSANAALLQSTAAATTQAAVTSGVSSRRVLLAGGAAAIVLPAGVVAYKWLARPMERIDSIAVLPLKNLSGDPAQEYFSDGVTEELIGEIGRITTARVVSRTSVMRYKNATQNSLAEIAGQLKADAVLEGSVTQVSGKVCVNVRLVRALDDRQLWSGRYERDASEILSMQNDVARAVAAEIRANLTRAGEDRPGRAHSVSPEAYRAYLKGSYFLHQGISGTSRSVEFFTEAARLDPRHAPSHAGLAEALVFAAIFGLRPSQEAYPAAEAAARRALEIDPSSAPGHAALADVKKGYEWNLAGAEAEYRLGLKADPNHVISISWHADCLSRMNRHDEALQQQSRLLSLDPVSPMAYGSRSMLMWRARRYDEAIQLSQQALEFAPHFVNARWWLGSALASKGDLTAATECFQKALTTDRGPVFRGLLGYVYGLAGERSRVRQTVEELTAIAAQRFVSPMDFAIVYAGSGDAAATFHSLEDAYRTRAARMHEVAWPYFDRVRSDARHKEFLKRTGLPS